MQQSLMDHALRRAEPADAAAVLDVISALRMDRPDAAAQGYLRLRHTPADYERFAENGYLTLAIRRGEIAGFLVAFPWQNPELAGHREMAKAVEWSDLAVRDALPSILAATVCIDEIGVSPAYIRTGIGRALMQRLMAWNPASHFVSTSMEAPMMNTASAAFHEALGFERVGRFETADYLGLSPFQSGIWLKMARPLFPAAHD